MAKSTKIINTKRDANVQHRSRLINRCNQETKKTQTSEQTEQTNEDHSSFVKVKGTKIVFSSEFCAWYCHVKGFESTEDFINSRNNHNQEVDPVGLTSSDNE